MHSSYKVIGLVGYSGSGKTYLIETAIKLLKKHFNFQIAVIKNIHEHQIDEEGKDTFKYLKAGGNYAITKNVYNETTIFIRKYVDLPHIMDWISKGPFQLDLIFIEGFRNLDYPTILCVNKLEDIESQLTIHVKMISGLICKEKIEFLDNFDAPIVDIEEDFEKFLEIFDLK
ncbi:MAG: molybdopterin-guanine dinucleotide biosynthesis protein B [Promethearchaeota archaeon]